MRSIGLIKIGRGIIGPGGSALANSSRRRLPIWVMVGGREIRQLEAFIQES
jgi:hypothetical protein